MKAPTGKLAFAYRTISELEAERDQLRAEVEALRQDAGRYRWTCVEGNWVGKMFGKWRAHTSENSPTDWFDSRDAAIDAAMAAKDGAQ